MTRSVVAILLLTTGVIRAADPPPAAGKATARINGHTFTLPTGFEIDLIAGADLVQRPVAVTFDDAGHLYVTEASGTNEPTVKQLVDKPHRVVRLTDKDGDGRFDTSTVFAEKLMLPQGIMWLNGSIYVGNPPEITKFTDTDGDGKADKREVWYDGKTLTGCANDLHGPYLGPDGWVYWTKGAFALQEHMLPNGKKFVTRASHIFRARPDGTGREPVMTGGMDNPVDVAFLPNGDIFFTTTFLQHPANGRRDGIIHATYGAVFGKDQDPLYDHPWTRPALSAPLVHLGAAAPCGLQGYDSDALGAGYRGNLFACCFNMQKVTRHILTPQGSTYRTVDSDFLVSDNRDFHPTDVIQGTDGSLIVVDTGGWYKMCCPTSQLVKPDVLGGIYRVRKIGVKATAAKHTTPPVADHSPHESVEAIAARLKSSSGWERRVAAENLGRLGDARAVPAILTALADETNDIVLDTALTRALIDIGDAKAVTAGLAHTSPRTERAAIAALENIPASGLKPSAVLPHLTAQDVALRETAWWVAGRHPDWGGAVAAYFKETLGGRSLAPADRDQLAGQLAKFARSTAVQQFIAERIADTGTPTDVRLVAMTAGGRASLRQPPLAWYDSAVKALREGGTDLTRGAVALVRALPAQKKAPTGLADALRAAALNTSLPQEVRFQALAAIPGGPGRLSPDLVAELVAAVHRDHSIPIRSAAAEALSKASLDRDQLLTLTTAFKTAAPMELDRLLEPFAHAIDERVGLALLDALQASPLRTSLRVDMLKPRLAKYSPAVQSRADTVYAALNADLAGQRAKLESLLTSTTGGDVRRGQLVFNSAKASCIACHSMGYLGGKVGPDLTRIGGVRTERDLLEAIVFPSASFVRSFEPVKATTLDGKTFSGVLTKDAPDEVVLTVSATEVVRLARADIDEMTPGTVSVMPNGLDQQLSLQDLADLIAFLKASK